MHRAPFWVHVSSVPSALNAVPWCRLACPSASHAVRAFHEAGWSGRGSRFFSNFFLTTAPCKTSEKSLESAFARNVQDPVSGMQSHIFSFSFLVKALPLPPPVFWIFWRRTTVFLPRVRSSQRASCIRSVVEPTRKVLATTKLRLRLEDAYPCLVCFVVYFGFAKDNYWGCFCQMLRKEWQHPYFGIESVMKKRRSSLIQFSEKKDRWPIEAVAERGLSGTWRVCDVIASGEIMPSRAETTVGLNPNNPARSVGFIQNSVSKF